MNLFTCFFGHLWGKWKVEKCGTARRIADKAVVGHIIVQKRECERCGRTELDTQTEYI